MMNSCDLITTVEQRYERFVEDADQARLAKQQRAGRVDRSRQALLAWVWLRRMVASSRRSVSGQTTTLRRLLSPSQGLEKGR